MRPRSQLTHTGPLGAFENQTFGYAIRVTSMGDGVAKDVEVVDTLPNAGTLVDPHPAGTPAAAGASDRYVIAVGDLQPGEVKSGHRALEGARRREQLAHQQARLPALLN